MREISLFALFGSVLITIHLTTVILQGDDPFYNTLYRRSPTKEKPSNKGIVTMTNKKEQGTLKYTKSTASKIKPLKGSSKSYKGSTKPKNGITKSNKGTTTSKKGTKKSKKGTTESKKETKKLKSGTKKSNKGTKKSKKGTKKSKKGTKKSKKGTKKSKKETKKSKKGTKKSKTGTKKSKKGTTKSKKGTKESNKGTKKSQNGTKKSKKETTTTARQPSKSEKTSFPAMYLPLTNYQVGATPVSEDKYPWLASVIHSRTRDKPHMCTAACTDNAIFVTSARCILTLKVAYTSVKYKGRKFNATAFVTPTNPTFQSFEDIGIIVVDDQGFNDKWDTIGIQLIDVKRKDPKYQWFSDLNLSKEKDTFRVVGYAAEKYYSKLKEPDLPVYVLSELDVKVSRRMCEKILYKANVHGFDVPCYMACTLEQYMENTNQDMKEPTKNPSCLKYHGVEGGAVINVNINKLLGVATWGVTRDSGNVQNLKAEFPVGFAVPNSENFYKGYACATKIRDSPKQTGSYQHVCQ